jgi:hypothetical protein
MDKIFVEIREIPYLRNLPSSIGIFSKNHEPLLDKLINVIGIDAYHKCNILIESKNWFEYQRQSYEN